MSAATTPTYEWKALPWRKLERGVFKLQRRIYRAADRGDRRTVHRLQRLLLRARAARLLAVRRVSQDNRGKRTAGVDGVKALTPTARLALAEELVLPVKAMPTRRVWIPKPGTNDQRPLGIPTMRDRSTSPGRARPGTEWEARFESNSYGFRPTFGCTTRWQRSSTGSAPRRRRVGRRHHQVLRSDRPPGPAPEAPDHTHTATCHPRLAPCRVVDGRELPTEAGTPQGGVASPLLANIALHGLETAITPAYPGTIRARRRTPELATDRRAVRRRSRDPASDETVILRSASA
jgi:RNA-directed DNA polymerase